MVRGQWASLGFLMTTESQDLGLMSHPKDSVLLCCFKHKINVQHFFCEI